MDAERWMRIREIFDQAVLLEELARDTFLDNACGTDASLRGEIDELLAADERPAPIFERSPESFAAAVEKFDEEEADDSAPHIPESIGRYRIVREIGRGGMSRVLLAERSDGQFDQQVALKLLKPGMDSEEIGQRFRLERQILAGLVHPKIARLYDGGLTDNGHQFFVMEYVDGLPIDRFVKGNSLSLKERLGLFKEVCGVVQFAHQNLIVHRDLKPSNILVTQSGDVKLLDFGIAKLLEENPTLDVPKTRTGIRVMTPEYASPEQIAGTPVTTATDVYSLGVVLYELLTGQRPTPASVPVGPPDTQPVDPPSKVVDKERSRLLRGDLDTIVLKALRHEPERRYSTPQALLEDIQRYLEGMPVKARPDSLGYRAGKFVRRNRVSLAAVTAIVVLIIGFTITMAIQRAEVIRQRDSAEALTSYLEGLFGSSDPMLPQAIRRDTLRVRELLTLGVTSAGEELRDQPLIRARLLNTLGRVHLNLAMYAEAEPLLTEALEIRRSNLGRGHPDALATDRLLAQVHWRMEQPALADSLLLETEPLIEAEFGSESLQMAQLYADRANVSLDVGKFEDAERIAARAVDLFERVGQGSSFNALKARNNLGRILQRQGKYSEAEPVLRETIRLANEGGYGDTIVTGLAAGNLSIALSELGLYEEAVDYARRSYEINAALLDENHTSSVNAAEVLATALSRAGEHAEAEKIMRDVSDRRRETDGPASVAYARSLNMLGFVLGAADKSVQASPLHHEAEAIFRNTLGPEHPFVGMTLNNLGRSLADQRASAEAERAFEEAIEIFQHTFAEDHLFMSYPLLGLGWAITDRDPVKAETQLRMALKIRLTEFEPDHTDVAEVETFLGRALLKQGRIAEAETLLVRANEVAQKGNDAALKRYAREHLEEFYAVTDGAGVR